MSIEERFYVLPLSGPFSGLSNGPTRELSPDIYGTVDGFTVDNLDDFNTVVDYIETFKNGERVKTPYRINGKPLNDNVTAKTNKNGRITRVALAKVGDSQYLAVPEYGVSPRLNNGTRTRTVTVSPRSNGSVSPRMNNGSVSPRMNNGSVSPRMNNGSVSPRRNGTVTRSPTRTRTVTISPRSDGTVTATVSPRLNNGTRTRTVSISPRVNNGSVSPRRNGTVTRSPTRTRTVTISPRSNGTVSPRMNNGTRTVTISPRSNGSVSPRMNGLVTADILDVIPSENIIAVEGESIIVDPSAHIPSQRTFADLVADGPVLIDLKNNGSISVSPLSDVGQDILNNINNLGTYVMNLLSNAGTNVSNLIQPVQEQTQGLLSGLFSTLGFGNNNNA